MHHGAPHSYMHIIVNLVTVIVADYIAIVLG